MMQAGECRGQHLRRGGRVDRDMTGGRISGSFIFVFSASASMTGIQQVLNECLLYKMGENQSGI